MSRLAEKVAVITGGAGGIGIATGKRFSSEGARVLLVDLDEKALADACAEIGGRTCAASATKATRGAVNASAFIILSGHDCTAVVISHSPHTPCVKV